MDQSYTAGEIVDKLHHAWRDLNIHDIECGLHDHDAHSSSPAVTFLSRDIETEALEAASTTSAHPVVFDANLDSDFTYDYCFEVISGLLSDESQAFGPSIWPEFSADGQESSASLDSTTSSLVWSNEANRKRIHRGLIDIMKLNMQYIIATEHHQQEEVQTLEQSQQVASNTKTLNADDLMAHAMQIWASEHMVDTTQRLPKVQNLKLDGDGELCLEVLKKEPDNVYRFCTDNHAHAVECRFSFDELRQRWKHASKKAQRDNGSFPHMRPKPSESTSFNDRFHDCIVRCACRKCNNGIPVVWKCKPYDFDKKHQILVHRFVYKEDQHYENWAYILADWDDSEPAGYRLWGSHLGDPKNITGYNEFFKLEEHTKKPSESQLQEHVIHHGYATRGSKRRGTVAKSLDSDGIDVQSMQYEDDSHDTRPNKRTKTTGQWSNVDTDEPTAPVEAAHIAPVQMQDESPMRNGSTAPIQPDSKAVQTQEDSSAQEIRATPLEPSSINATPTQEVSSTPRQRTTPMKPNPVTSNETRQDTPTQADSTATTQPQPSTTETDHPPPAHPTASAQTNPNTCNRPPSTTRHQRPPPPPTPARTPVPNLPKLDLSACFRAAFTHLRKQKEDGNWSCILTTNDTFIGLARDLRFFKDQRDEDSFRDMWAEIDAELAQAGLEALPALEEADGGGSWEAGG